MNDIVIYLSAMVLVITSIFGLLQSKKWKAMLFFTIGNASVAISYFLLNHIAGGILVCISVVRTLIFFFYSYKNKKPSWIIFAFLELYAVVMIILFWESPVDIIILINMLLITYATWQNNPTIMRIGYVLMSALYITYNSIIGAYFNNIGEAIMIISSVYSLYYFVQLSNKKDVIYNFYNRMRKPYSLTFTEYDNYTLLFSSFMNDEYNNFAIYNNLDIKKEDVEQIKEQFSNLLRKPLLYVRCNNSEQYNKVLKISDKYKLVFHDTWMKLKSDLDYEKINSTPIPKLECMRAVESDKKAFINVFNKGFVRNVGDDCDRSPNCYTKFLESFYSADFMAKNKIHPYVAKVKGKIVALLIVYVTDNMNEAYVYNVTTLKEYRNKGISSRLLKFAIKDLRLYGVKDFYTVAIKYSNLEIFCLKNNFYEISQGFCFDISDDNTK